MRGKQGRKRIASNVVKKAKEKKWKSLGRYLAEIRQKAGLSQAQVAKLMKPMKIGPQFISNIERGICSPPEDLLRELVMVYQIDPDSLIKELLSVEKDRLEATFKKYRSEVS